MNKVLVDLAILKDIYCGLGQVALSYARYFQENYKRDTAGYSLTLLVPDNMIGLFGNEVEYLSSTKWVNKRFQFLLPKFDVWHSIHQLSRFKPWHKRTKHILTVHDLNYLHEREGYSRERKHRQIQRKINRADKIVCISHFAKTEVETHLNLQGKECSVIYNHVKSLNPTNAKKPKLEISKAFFFSIGVIQKKKNFHVLLDLMKLMPDMQLYIAGKEIQRDKKKNAYAEMIKERIRNENITNVQLIGAISDDEKIWMYKNCKAFLIPSLLEGFGLPVIEAMQFGKPVFSSPETSLKEIGGKFAYFWDNFNPEHMKSVIDSNLENFYTKPETAEKQQEYAFSFSTGKHFKEYENLYKTI